MQSTLLQAALTRFPSRPARRSGSLVAALTLAVALALLLGLLPAMAQETPHRAGIVIRDEAGEISYGYVTFPEEEISSLELLRRSGILFVSVSFGVGDAICSIGATGCDVAECRQRLCQGSRVDDPFWHFYRQVAPGDWRWQMRGASDSMVRDGDIDGWSWTSNQPRLPGVTLEQIADRAEAQPPPTPAEAPDAAPWPVYAGAGVIILIIGAGALVLVRRRADRRPPS